MAQVAKPVVVGYVAVMAGTPIPVTDEAAAEAAKAVQRSIGKRVSAWRRLRDMSAEKLAVDSGCSYDMLRSIESGRSAGSILMLTRLSLALGIPFETMVAVDPPAVVVNPMVRRGRRKSISPPEDPKK